VKVVIKRSSTYELILNDEGVTIDGQHLEDIPDVLADNTADDEEKTKTIVYTFEGNYGLPLRDIFKVFVFNDDGTLKFTGEIGEYT